MKLLRYARGARGSASFVGAIVVVAIAVSASSASRASFLGRLWDDLVAGATSKAAPAPAAAAAAAGSPSSSPTTASRPQAAAPTTATAAPAAVAQAAPGGPAAEPIPVVKPKVQTVSETLQITGNAAAVNQVKLIARVVGYLEQIHFQDGQLVNKGDLLFTIQQDQYKAQLQQAQAQLAQAQAQLIYAKTEVVRYTALLKKDAATQVEVDHWTFERASAEANIQAAEAQVAIAKLNLGYTEVRAPFDGQMGKHLIDPGNVVGGNGQEAALAEILQLDPIYVVANVSSQTALQIRANLDQRRLTLQEIHQIPVGVQLSNETGFPRTGTIEYVAPQIDPQTGTLLVRGILRNPNRTLLPGMFVNIRLPMGKTLQSALLIPSIALQEDQGGRYALVIGPDNVIQQRYVKLGQTLGNEVLVTDGLAATDEVVVGELWRATPGTKVVPKLTAGDG